MRIRIIFKKTEPMRYTSHLDLHRTWGRTIRRAGLPLAYSEGFHPQPKINLACALPLGITSEHEVVDIWLESRVNEREILDRLMHTLPPGIEIISANEINDGSPTLQSTLVSTIYKVTLIDKIDDLESRVNALRDASQLIRVRRGKKYDLRPLIEDIIVHQQQMNNPQVITIQLAAREGATGRPDEVIDACLIDITSAQIQRLRLIFDNETGDEFSLQYP